MNKKNGTTLIELMVTLVIGTLMLLAVGKIADIGRQSEAGVINEAGIYNDIAYAFKLVQNRIHKTKSLTSTPITGGSTTWKDGTERLDVGAIERFGVYNEDGKENFVYERNGNRRTLLEADTMTMDLNPDPLVDEVEIILSGTKQDTPFNTSITINKRM